MHCSRATGGFVGDKDGVRDITCEECNYRADCLIRAALEKAQELLRQHHDCSKWKQCRSHCEICEYLKGGDQDV
jgi:hypothetical protein